MSTRSILKNELDSQYIQDFDCIRWYYRVVRKDTSDCKINVLCYLISLEDMHNTNDYFQANTTYIANRLFYSRVQISKILTELVKDNFIFKRIDNGNGTYIKINTDNIIQLEALYQTSSEYKLIHKNTNKILDTAKPKLQIVSKLPYTQVAAVN